MNRKAQSTTLTGLFLSVITVTAFTILFVMFFVGGANTYNLPVDNSSFSGLNKAVEITELTGSANQAVTGENSSSQPGQSNLDVLANSAYRSLKLIGNIPALFNDMFVTVGGVLGIPSIIVQLAFTFITIIFIGIAILLLFKVRV
jgi:hypothetical protein